MRPIFSLNQRIFLQLWVNLAQQYKMVEPRYQEVPGPSIPVAKKEGVVVKVISGECMGVKSVINTYTPIIYLDIRLDPNTDFIQNIPADHNAFIYTLKGEIFVGENQTQGVKAHHTVVSKGDFLWYFFVLFWNWFRVYFGLVELFACSSIKEKKLKTFLKNFVVCFSYFQLEIMFKSRQLHVEHTSFWLVKKFVRSFKNKIQKFKTKNI